MIIETCNLTKAYRRYEKEVGFLGSVKALFKRDYSLKTALANFDLSVGEGEFVGLIGPNGAGKTTLVKMLTGIIAPTTGSLSVMGYYPNKLENGFKKQYAVVMGQKSQLFFELTPSDTFLLFKELYGISDEEYKQSISYFTDLFDVSKYLNVQVRTLSLGERMKMELIVALLHNPKILFLDEPTIGLDAVAQKQVRSFLKEVNQTKGTTILLTSHYMEDIKSLCKRCVVVKSGEKIYDGETDALFERYQKYKKMTLLLENNIPISLPPECEIVEENGYKRIFFIPREQAQEVLKMLMAYPELRDISIEEEEIGSVVERIYRDTKAVAP